MVTDDLKMSIFFFFNRQFIGNLLVNMITEYWAKTEHETEENWYIKEIKNMSKHLR